MTAHVPTRIIVALVVVQVIFGVWPVVGAVLLETLNPAQLIAFRTIFGGVTLVLVFGRFRPSGRDAVELAFLGALGVASNQLFFAEGLYRAGPINAAVLSPLIAPCTLLMAVLARTERPTRPRLIGMAVAFLGALWLVGVERFETSAERTTGNLLLLASSLCYGAYLAWSPATIARLGAFRVVAWVYVFAALEALPWTAPELSTIPWHALGPRELGLLAFVLLGPTFLAYALNAYALKSVESSVVALFVYLQPIVAVATEWLWRGKAIEPRTAAAALVIFVGVGLSTGTLRGRAQ